ncbi:surfactin synthase thioesterase subunit [Thermocatellispora tengchongensis]|uniref:Surfactin synthase thioesterase subunit n=1 Tax=Thermocatellispora tengchongensis TaxID=1073253 RepID=A0A840PA30_9ACTN|nr:alpha/beta fold hydrolase [Thermocatellispora tengchongensis]MBB5135506.1 surfactin synthase thioesterase subunit [Thermocatellispora tengchongensis]
MSTPVLCLPFAGAGASFFHPWCRLGVPGVEVVPVQLPGRERRLAEPPYRDVHEAADGLLPGVLASVSGAEKVALFGHSLGAVLAYELARRLSAEGAVPVARLFVSGSPGPWTQRERRATGLDDDAFLARVKEFAGYRHEAFDEPEMRELLLPTLRADVEMHENYRPVSREPIAVPVTAIRGGDDTLVTAGDVAQWREATRLDFATAELPGGHMYLTDGARPLLELIAGSLEATALCV